MVRVAAGQRATGQGRVDYRRLAGDLSDLSLGAGESLRLHLAAPAAAPPPPAAAVRRTAQCLSSLTPSRPSRAPAADALGTDFRALHSELLSYGGYRAGGGHVRSLPAAQLTPAWLQQHGAFRPVLVPGAPGAARDLGLALPEGSLTVDRLAARIGLPWEVHTLDTQTQGEGPRWTLHQWCAQGEGAGAACGAGWQARWCCRG